MALRTSDFDYPLDKSLIAQVSAERRDQSRLMALTRPDGGICDHVFADLPRLLRPGDVLVVNDTRVLPAKFLCRRRTAGRGRIAGLFCREVRPGLWEVMLKNAGRCKPDEELVLSRGQGVHLVLQENLGDGLWQVRPQPPPRPPPRMRRAGR